MSIMNDRMSGSHRSRSPSDDDSDGKASNRSRSRSRDYAGSKGQPMYLPFCLFD